MKLFGKEMTGAQALAFVTPGRKCAIGAATIGLVAGIAGLLFATNHLPLVGDFKALDLGIFQLSKDTVLYGSAAIGGASLIGLGLLFKPAKKELSERDQIMRNNQNLHPF